MNNKINEVKYVKINDNSYRSTKNIMPSSYIYKKNNGFKYFLICVCVFFLIGFVFSSIQSGDGIGNLFNFESNDFSLLVSYDNKGFYDSLIKYADTEDIDLSVDFVDDLEAIEILESGQNNYDGVWLSNSVWLYMLNSAKVSSSKSTNINPVVFGIKKSKAESLGFVNKDIYNKDIVNAIKDKKLNYVMSSVTKTNTGLIGYLGFLNALSGSPEILTNDMLNNKQLVTDLKALFSGVERVSGDVDFLNQMFLNSSKYDAVLATESSLIEINKELENNNKETLYLIYPVDGVAINDSPFAYVDRKQKKEELFDKLQKFVLSEESQKNLEKQGKRTWYGGIKAGADINSFKKEWGIDTTKYLIPLKYPSKDVMDFAINLYLDNLRKPSSIAFCLDFSGSMYGTGEHELKSAMSQILDYEEASKDKIQFAESDIIRVIPFESYTHETLFTNNGKNTFDLISKIDGLISGGGTNVYNCAEHAIEEMNNDSDEYNKTIILMTDGQTAGSISNLQNMYRNGVDIPIYSIMFGDASASQLQQIAELTNAKVFDGRTDLTKAFKEVRSYN